MTTPSSINRRVCLTFGGSVLLFGLVWWIAHYERTVPTAGAAEFAALTSERVGLQGGDERVRDRLREQQRGLTRIAWNPARLATLQQRQGAGWRWSWEPGEPRSRVTLQRVAPRIEEWPAYAALVAELAAQPGVIIESVEILAEGAARDRRFTRVAIGLRFIVAVAPSRDRQRAAPSPGPPTVAPAAGPATRSRTAPPRRCTAARRSPPT
jgi:hypothetical protein